MSSKIRVSYTGVASPINKRLLFSLTIYMNEKSSGEVGANVGLCVSECNAVTLGFDSASVWRGSDLSDNKRNGIDAGVNMSI